MGEAWPAAAASQAASNASWAHPAPTNLAERPRCSGRIFALFF